MEYYGGHSLSLLLCTNLYMSIYLYVHTYTQCCPFAVTSANKSNKAYRWVTYLINHAYTMSLCTVLPFCRDGVDLSHQEALNLGEVCSKPYIFEVNPLWSSRGVVPQPCKLSVHIWMCMQTHAKTGAAGFPHFQHAVQVGDGWGLELPHPLPENLHPGSWFARACVVVWM